MNDLQRLGDKYGAFKGPIVKKDDFSRDFYEHYEHHFGPIREKKLRLLEIGIRTGGSLKMWAKYFSDVHVDGVDISPECKKEYGRNIGVFIGDQSDKAFLDTLPMYDIIIDDGSHVMEHQVKSFDTLWRSHLNDGGIYVVEDLETSYWPAFDGGFQEPATAIKFLMGLVNNLNWEAVCHERAEGRSLDVENLHIASIHFYKSICFLYKQ